tara:strand:+ start:352 stop:558 length:207 start_codon:yes stop_codon:yes gene_type:complete
MKDLTTNELSFIIDVLDTTVEQKPKMISKYESWNGVDSSTIYKKVWHAYTGNHDYPPSSLYIDPHAIV